MKHNISKCSKCPFHELVEDPDPFDWFGSTDSALICTHKDCVRPYEYPSIKEEHEKKGWITPGKTCISSGLGAFEVDKVKIPTYCPLKKQENNVK